MLESDFERHVVSRLEEQYPGCVILKNDPRYIQGVPDRLILHGNRWAALEVKKSATAKERPNQRYWAEHFDSMSFCQFIFPENEHEVFHELQQALRHRR